jgi:hypothetical protein
MEGELMMRELHLWQLGKLMARVLTWCKKMPIMIDTIYPMLID